MKTLSRGCIVLLTILSALNTSDLRAQTPGATETEETKLNVVWSSADPDVAMNVCFMFTLNAKKNGWFDVVHLIIWGPSAKLLAENEHLQQEVQNMQEVGVVVEACRACAERYGVSERLAEMEIDVDWMGVPLADRLKGDWKTVTF